VISTTDMSRLKVFHFLRIREMVAIRLFRGIQVMPYSKLKDPSHPTSWKASKPATILEAPPDRSVILTNTLATSKFLALSGMLTNLEGINNLNSKDQHHYFKQRGFRIISNSNRSKSSEMVRGAMAFPCFRSAVKSTVGMTGILMMITSFMISTRMSNSKQ